MKTRILFYNWDPIAGPAGGGVTAYLTELISHFICDSEYEVWFLNAGRKYTSDCHPRLERRENIFGNKVQSYEIVNSPILSPGNQSIINIRKYLEDDVVYGLCRELIEIARGFDIVHYHNLEGLSLKALTLKVAYPDTKFIYSFHNYFPICTQVNLWKDNEKNCHTKDFTQCGNCYQKENYDLTLFRFQHINIPMLKDIFMEYSGKHPDKDNPDLYRRFRDKNILFFNHYMDRLLAVSQRTKEVLVKNGIDERKICTMYVGSKIAKYQKTHAELGLTDRELHIVYLGYMRKDKGFYFFIDALHKMEKAIAKQIVVTIIARYSDKNITEMEKILLMKQKFSNVIIYNGYRDYAELEKILSTQHLGVVPNLWEDNLPRVAIEQVAFGLPILCSNLGGASELGGRNSDFVFEAGNSNDFLRKLTVFVKDRKKLQKYWNHAMKLTTMQEHLKQLKAEYNRDK